MAKKEKKKLRAKNVVINLFLLLMLLVGLALVFNNQIKYFLMELMGDRYGTEHYSPDDLDKNSRSKQTFDFDGVRSVSTEEVLSAQFKNAGLPVIGEIAIPDLKINLPIFKGLSNTVLLYGAGTMMEDQKMGEGNYCLASHRVDDPRLLFSPLQNAKEGQFIYLTDLKKIYKYKTTSVERVLPEETQVLDAQKDKKTVTLITCNDPGAIKRIVVKGELVDTKTLKEATSDMKKAMKKHVNQGYW